MYTLAELENKTFEELVELSRRGNTITEQNINYALSLAAEERTSAITEIDKDYICHTLNGRPIKPKTLGQKAYVDEIRKKMIVFGLGPAGTGKTYLAMAMAITAFKNDEVGRIILTRPAIEAGEKLGKDFHRLLTGLLGSQDFQLPVPGDHCHSQGTFHLFYIFIKLPENIPFMFRRQFHSFFTNITHAPVYSFLLAVPKFRSEFSAHFFR